jgi:hypothetical protein
MFRRGLDSDVEGRSSSRCTPSHTISPPALSDSTLADRKDESWDSDDRGERRRGGFGDELRWRVLHFSPV